MIRTELLDQPSFELGKMFIDQGDSIRVEAGASVKVNGAVRIDSQATGEV